MCGLTGYITKQGIELTPEQSELRGRLFAALLVAMQARGTDSTGVSFIHGNERIDVKDIKSALEVVNSKPYKYGSANAHTIAIGHTRFATMGEITVANAHPYTFGTITGAHNGHVTNWREIKPDCTVDSQAIFHLLNENKNDYAKTLEVLRGGMAVTWYDSNTPDTIHLVRHDNPLYVVRIPFLSTIFWVSEIEPLLAIFTALGIVMDRSIDSFELKENKVYTISPKLEISKKNVAIPVLPYALTGTAGTGFDLKKYDDIDGSYTEGEAMTWQVENGGCELCSKPIDPVSGFYWSINGYYAMCLACGAKSNNPDYEYISPNRYRELLHREMLEGLYD